jgi:hypothetical protein
MTKREVPEQLSIEMVRHGYELVHSGAIGSGVEPTTSVLTFAPPSGGTPVSMVVAAAREGTIRVRHSPVYEDVSRLVEAVLAEWRSSELEAERLKGLWQRLFGG